MKRIILALGIFGFLISATRQTEAATDVSIDFFYNNLGDNGSWIEVGDYGYCWQPAVAVSNTKWRPYSDGYWAYTDVGWTWISNEDFGWATYHYGRWARLRDQGWVWVPGREWGPAWVSWRTGGDYVGWAPLPPHRGGGGEVVYEGRPIDSRVDIDFDIGPAYYNFVDVRYIGEPILRDRIFQPEQNVTYISRTVNVTNITYNNSIYYNHGPDYNRLSAYSTRQIPRLTLARESNVDLSVAARSGNLTKVQGNRLVVATPATFQKPAQQVAPKVVKTKIAQPNLERGWAGVTDPKTKAELQQKIKTEDPKTVPPPDLKPTNPAALNAASPGASPAAASASPAALAPAVAASPTTAISPVPQATTAPSKGDDKSKRGIAPQPAATPTTEAAPDASAAPAVSPNELKREGKDKRGGAGQIAQPTTSTDLSSPVVQPTPAAREKGQRPKDRTSVQPLSPAAPTAAPPDGTANESGRSDKKPERGLYAPNPETPGDASAPKGDEKSKKKTEPVRNPRETDPPIAALNTPAAGAPAKEKAQPPSREVREPRNRPPGNATGAPQVRPQGNQGQAPQGQPPQGQGMPGKGKRDKAEEAPSPAPGQ